MSWPDALASVAMLAFVAFIVWVCARPTSTRGDDKHVNELRKLVTELTTLRAQVDRMVDGNGSRADSHLTTDNPTSRT